MPIPQPKKGETKKKFIDRCMSSKVMKDEYPDRSQRYAVCESQYKNKHNYIITRS